MRYAGREMGWILGSLPLLLTLDTKAQQHTVKNINTMYKIKKNGYIATHFSSAPASDDESDDAKI